MPSLSPHGECREPPRTATPTTVQRIAGPVQGSTPPRSQPVNSWIDAIERSFPRLPRFTSRFNRVKDEASDLTVSTRPVRSIETDPILIMLMASSYFSTATSTYASASYRIPSSPLCLPPFTTSLGPEIFLAKYTMRLPTLPSPSSVRIVTSSP